MPRPQRPSLVFRIGVTGHRPGGLSDADLPVIRKLVSRVFDIVEDVVSAAALEPSLGYNREYGLRVISPLSEGADRIVVAEALNRESPFEFDCILPFPAKVCLDDFETSQSKAEFSSLLSHARRIFTLDGVRDRGKDVGDARAYEAVGNAILQNCDLLLAIWDGQDKQLIGGTSQIVRAAAFYGIPVAWIDSRRDHELSLLRTRAGEIQGPESIDNLRERVRELVGPAVTHASITERNPLDLREQFFQEVELEDTPFSQLFDAIVDWASFPAEPQQNTSDVLPTMPHTVDTQLQQGLGPAYAISNQLAVAYARRYRSAFSFLYLLAILAVVLALASLWLKARPLPSPFEEIGSPLEVTVEIGEVVVLGAICVLYWYARRKRWHERWMDYRAIAEQIRQHCFLLPAARTSGVMAVPPRIGVTDAATWTEWYVRSIVREVGTLTADLTAPGYLAAYRDVLWRNVADQIAYHATREAKYKYAYRTLEDIAKWSFILAVFSAVFHLVIPSVDVLSVFSVLLPAAGALIHGFLSQADFATLSQRSARMQRQLHKLERDLSREADDLTAGTGISSTALATLAEAFASTMTSELSDWRGNTRARPVVLP